MLIDIALEVDAIGEIQGTPGSLRFDMSMSWLDNQDRFQESRRLHDCWPQAISLNLFEAPTSKTARTLAHALVSCG